MSVEPCAWRYVRKGPNAGVVVYRRGRVYDGMRSYVGPYLHNSSGTNDRPFLQQRRTGHKRIGVHQRSPPQAPLVLLDKTATNSVIPNGYDTRAIIGNGAGMPGYPDPGHFLSPAACILVVERHDIVAGSLRCRNDDLGVPSRANYIKLIA